MSLILPAFSSPDLKAFPHSSKSSKSSEGDQTGLLCVPAARQCDLFRCAPQIPQTRLNLASALGRWWFLVNVYACGGKTLISRLILCPSSTCRGLSSLPARCSCQPSDTASQRRKSVPTIRAVRGTPASASVFLDRYLPPEGMCLVYINGKGMHLTAIASRCFYCAGNVS